MKNINKKELRENIERAKYLFYASRKLRLLRVGFTLQDSQSALYYYRILHGIKHQRINTLSVREFNKRENRIKNLHGE